MSKNFLELTMSGNQSALNASDIWRYQRIILQKEMFVQPLPEWLLFLQHMEPYFTIAVICLLILLLSLRLSSEEGRNLTNELEKGKK